MNRVVKDKKTNVETFKTIDMDCMMNFEPANNCCCGMELKKCTYKKYNTCSTNKLKIFWYKIKKLLKTIEK